MKVGLNLDFRALNASLLLAGIALPVSVLAFAIVYTRDDPFWAIVWLEAILPAVWVIVAVLLIRDALRTAVKRGSWRQIISAACLLAPTILLVVVMGTPRFIEHQLFALRRVDFEVPANPVLFLGRFAACQEGSTCTPNVTITETGTFKVENSPEGCCSLSIVNGGRGKHKVEAFRIFLNDKEITPRTDELLRLDPSQLMDVNRVRVQLNGPADSYIYLVVFAKSDKSRSIEQSALAGSS